MPLSGQLGPQLVLWLLDAMIELITLLAETSQNMSTIPSIGVKQKPSYTWDRTKEALIPPCPLTSTMPATASTILSRCIAWFTGKSNRLPSEELAEETEDFHIRAPPTLQDAHPGAALSALPQQQSPLALLEHSLLCTAQGVVATLEEPQTTVSVRAARATAKVAVVEFVEPTPMEVEMVAPSPTISLTPPTPKKSKPKADSRSFTPLQIIGTAPGTLRPSGKWHGRKNISSRRVHDKENRAPATAGRPLKTREERVQAYTPPARLLGLRQGQEHTARFLTSHRF